jgi:polyphosphate kinase
MSRAEHDTRDETAVTAEVRLDSAAVTDRDVSWLEFNRRVLHEALDARTPLLERLKFLAIFSSNLDEFFMKRIGLQSLHAGKLGGREDGRREKLARLRATVQELIAAQARCFRDELIPGLAAHGIDLLRFDELDEARREAAHAVFTRLVFPALTPLSVDPAHPFPLLSNLSTSLGVRLVRADGGEPLFARVKVPTGLPAWVELPAAGDGRRVFVRLHELIRANLDDLFPGLTIDDVTLFRITRNAEVDLDEHDVDDLREHVEAELRLRKFEPVVRLEVQPEGSAWVEERLVEEFELSPDDVYVVPGEMDYATLFALAGLPIPELRDPPWTPVPPLALSGRDADLFAAIRAGEFLVHHPYESFDASVERFIRTAADDPQVVAIKMTVYRVGDDTPFVKSLIRAAESGKQVVCLIELQARFDEARNLHWAEQLERVAAHVIYGVVGLKTHTKIALVVRQEPDGLRCYAHIGTGNYHVKTARLYTDVGLFTSEPELTGEVVHLFHYLTGHSRKRDYCKLLVAPMNMRSRFLELIGREAANARDGRPARIIAKMNQLEDPEICAALCEASRAGVPIDLIVRGFATLRAGVPGVSENIRILSIIGRFLEHSRIYHFANGSEDPLEGDFLIGSADWMNRNLSQRVEAIAPVEPRHLRERLWEILSIGLADHRQAWEMQPDGTYVQRRPPEGATGPAAEGTHVTLMNLTRRRERGLRG